MSEGLRRKFSWEMLQILEECCKFAGRKPTPDPSLKGRERAYPQPLPEGKGDKKRKKMKEITMIKRQRGGLSA